MRSCTELMQMSLPAAFEMLGATPCRDIARPASRQHRNWPVRLIPMTVSQSFESHIDKAGIALHAGIGNQNVEPAEMLDRSTEHADDLFLVRDIGFERERLST